MVLKFTILVIFCGMIVSLLFGRRVIIGVKSWKRSSKIDRETLDLMNSGQDHPAFIAKIPDIAERHRRQMKDSFGEKLNYQKSDLARLDAIIDKAWGEELPKNLDALVLIFGAYFGETLRKLRGGRWDYDSERGYCLHDVGGMATVYPFEKVTKRFKKQKEHSLALFYKALVKTVEKTA
ncbi:MAG: hypothetical protein ACI8T1_004539 [Verrucomicrobiales bacterium]|jgi:hypothetical protein